MATEYNLGTARGHIEIDYNGDGVKAADKELKGLQKTGGDTEKALDKTSKGLLLSGGVLAAGFAVATKTAASFESRLSAIKAVSGNTTEEMEKIRQKALQIGKDTAFSASGAASAIEELAKAGVSTADILNGAADATVALAAAGEVELPEAASIASNAMNQFGLAAKDLPNIADKIAGAANASAIDVSDFGMSLSQVGAVANLAGVSFDDTAAAIALLGNAGIKGSDAGTSLKSMFMRLIPTTNDQIQAMQDLGIITFDNTKAMQMLRDNGIKPLGSDTVTLQDQMMKLAAQLTGTKEGSGAAKKKYMELAMATGALHNEFFNANGEMKSFSEVADVLGTSLEGMTNEQKQATLTTLFGTDAVRAAAVVAEKGSKGINEMATSMGKVKAADVAATRMDNLEGTIEALKGSAETFAIQLGTVVLPTLKKMADGATKVLDKFIGLDDGTKKLIVVVGLAGAGLLLFLGTTIKVVKWTQELKKTMLLLNGGFGLFNKQGRLAVIITKAWALAQRALNFAFVANPIVGIIAIILLLAAAVVIAYKKSETFRNIVQSAWKAIRGAIESVIGWLTGTALPAILGVWDATVAGVQEVVAWIKNAWNSVAGAVSSAWDAVSSAIGTAIGAVRSVIEKGINIILSFWRSVWGLFGPPVTAIFGFIVALSQFFTKLLMVAIFGPIKLIQATWSLVWNAILAAATFVWNAIVAAVTFYFNLYKTIITTVLNAVLAVVMFIWNGIVAAVTAALNLLLSIVTTIWNAIKAPVMAALNFLKGFITSAWNGYVAILSSIGEKIKAVVMAVFNKAKDIATTAFNNLKTNATNAITGLLTFLGTIGAKIIGVFADAGTWLFDVGKRIIQGLMDGITAMFNKLKSLLNKLTDMLPDWKGPERVDRKLLTGTGETIMEGFIRGLEDSFPDVHRLLSNFTSDIPMALSGTTINNIAQAAPTGPSAGSDSALIAEIRSLKAEVARSAARTGAAFGDTLRGAGSSAALSGRTATGRI